MKEKGYPAIMDSLDSYEISDRYNVTDSMARDFVREFNQSDRILHLEPLADVMEYLPKLIKNDFRLIVITSLSDKNHAREKRLKNMKSIFGDIFDDLICLGQGSRKHDALLKWKDTGLFWIEDHYGNAQQGYDLGLKSILIDYPYNHKHEVDFLKVSADRPWKEITDIILDQYELN
jgi:FMN phosphatase YigB (HAD superfamily)